MTKEEYDARYRRRIPGFRHVAVEWDEKTFLFSGETWLVIALSAGAIFAILLFFCLPGLSAAWGAVGLAVRIIYGLALAACMLLLGLQDKYKFKRRWARVLSMALCAAFAIAIFLFFSLPAILDIGAKPVTGTFRVTRFITYSRSLNEDMVAIEADTRDIVKFPFFLFSREEKILREKLKTSQPVVTITYYPHSKVRTHMEY